MAEVIDCQKHFFDQFNVPFIIQLKYFWKRRDDEVVEPLFHCHHKIAFIFFLRNINWEDDMNYV